jgi:hypothetical protein
VGRDYPVDPPANGMMLLVDQKSDVQAIDRRQPNLPLKKVGRER